MVVKNKYRALLLAYLCKVKTNSIDFKFITSLQNNSRL